VEPSGEKSQDQTPWLQRQLADAKRFFSRFFAGTQERFQNVTK